MANKILGRDALGKRKFKTLEHPVPEWDGAVLLRRLSEAELTQIQKTARATVKASSGEDAGQTPEYVSRLRRSMVYHCWVDADGNQVLTDINDMDALADEEFAVIEGIAAAAIDHNGLNAKAAEEAEKN